MVINHFRVTKQAGKDKASFHFTGQRARLIGKETLSGRARDKVHQVSNQVTLRRRTTCPRPSVAIDFIDSLSASGQ